MGFFSVITITAQNKFGDKDWTLKENRLDTLIHILTSYTQIFLWKKVRKGDG